MRGGGNCGIMTGAMIAGIILAAGFSSRMGQPKALLPVGPGGETFVLHLVGTLRQAGLAPVLVVAGVDALRIRDALACATPPVQVAVNRDPSRGQISSLVTALDAVGHPHVEAVLVVPVDHPLVSVETVRRLVEAYRRLARGRRATRARRASTGIRSSSTDRCLMSCATLV